jgi:CAAX prenyl protease-like protein
MLVFIGFLALIAALRKIDNNIWLTNCEYWVYPLQTIVCGALLIRFWAEYAIERPKRVILGVIVGIVVFVLWISPQAFLGFAPRPDGFNPISMFGGQSLPYWPSVFFRFVRLVVVVPLVEEIFWRGFLLRYLIDEKFDRVPFDTFSWLSFSVVAVAFGFSHAQPDWVAAVITGMLYNWVAYSTKSLFTCVLTHATTNLLLGLWIMRTEQWGFW